MVRLIEEVVVCRECPRLVTWREHIAIERRAAFSNQEYWGRPVPGFGDPNAEIVVVGLAPAAHGGNRTGRIFTGDRSGDWLFASMYRTGLANQPQSVSRDDGLELRHVWVTASVKCAPPANKPTTSERDECVSRFLHREIESLESKKVIVCLGKFAYDVVCTMMNIRPRKNFGHGVQVITDQISVVGSYHPSQQNTFTGKLTEQMLDDVFGVAVKLANL